MNILCDPKVRELHDAAARQQDVVRLDVAVDAVLLVDITYGLEKLPEDVGHLALGRPPSTAWVRSPASTNSITTWTVPRRTSPRRDKVGVAEAFEGVDLVQEAGHEVGALEAFGLHLFHGNVPGDLGDGTCPVHDGAARQQDDLGEPVRECAL